MFQLKICFGKCCALYIPQVSHITHHASVLSCTVCPQNSDDYIYMKLPLEPNKDGRYGGILLGVLRVKHTHTNEVKRNGI